MFNKLFLLILCVTTPFLCAMESIEMTSMKDNKLRKMLKEVAAIRNYESNESEKSQEIEAIKQVHKSVLLYVIGISDEEASLAVAKIFVEKYGVDVDDANDRGVTPLIRASGYGYTDVVKYLLVQGANVNAQVIEPSLGKEDTALMRAARGNFKDIVVCLLEHGADKTITNHKNLTALDMAKRLSTTKDVISLLE